MAMAAADIQALIVAGIPDAAVEITDLAGDGNHYAAKVIAASFAGQSRIARTKAPLPSLELGGKVGGPGVRCDTRSGLRPHCRSAQPGNPFSNVRMTEEIRDARP